MEETMSKKMKAVLALVLGVTLIGSSLGLADPSPTGGGPFKPCQNCRTAPGDTGNGGK
jgi:hypothetical protein